MLYRRMIEAERRRSAPLADRELAVLRSGSETHARRWRMAARAAGFERLAARLIRATARDHATLRRDDARAARRQRDLCFYRVHALRYRDAA